MNAINYLLITAMLAMLSVAVYYFYKMQQRNKCEHEFEQQRICCKCGLRQKGVKDEPIIPTVE